MTKTTIIGRQKELERLNRLYDSEKSEFVAIYGRRRVGKSFLVDEAFKGKIVFNAVGVYMDEEGRDAQSYRMEQLSHFQGGKYIIVRHISSGGFGNTYEAQDVNLDKQ